MSDRDAQEARKRADEARVAQAGERWRARSRRVKLYRRVLPIVILMLAGGALTWTVFRTVMSGVERKASESREIRLDNPMFHGQDAQGRSFVVGAKGASRDPATGHFDYIAKHVALTPKNWWQVALVVGVAIGAFLSMRMSGARRKPISPIWTRALGNASPGRRYTLAFFAGFLMLFGARIADGCTSGHGISGMAQLAVSSTIAVLFMFIGGIITALFVLRRI